MKVLVTGSQDQTLKIIPREYVTSASVILKDDSTNVEATYSVTGSTDKNYLSLVGSYNLKEGRYYDMTVKDGANIIYKDKVFCTNQTIDQTTNAYFKPNKDVYTTNVTHDNEYIFV